MKANATLKCQTFTTYEREDWGCYFLSTQNKKKKTKFQIPRNHLYVQQPNDTVKIDKNNEGKKQDEILLESFNNKQWTKTECEIR